MLYMRRTLQRYRPLQVFQIIRKVDSVGNPDPDVRSSGRHCVPFHYTWTLVQDLPLIYNVIY
jgi:hypothetical protein